MTASPNPPSGPGSRTPSVAIVGTDLVLAAFPATPVQIAHACELLGFAATIPASWGDELIAAAAVDTLAARQSGPAVFCACPRVAERLLAPGPELSPFLLPLVAPPVAAARYVRALYGHAPVRITYLGGCGAALHEEIDARLTPREFLRTLQERGIVLGDMPRVFEGVIPPDRRRFHSLPGGLPAPDRLEAMDPPRHLACLTSADYAAELAQLILSGEPALVDVAARLGCGCAGATAATPYERARETVAALEPPRARAPVVEHELVIALGAELPEPSALPPAPMAPVPPSARTQPPQGEPVAPREVHHTPPAHARIPEPPTGPSRRRPTGVTGYFRGYTSDVPRTHTGEGGKLPRAYVGLRRGVPDERQRPGAAESRTPTGERELPLSRSVEPEREAEARPAPEPRPASDAPPGARQARPSDPAWHEAPTVRMEREVPLPAPASASPPGAVAPDAGTGSPELDAAVEASDASTPGALMVDLAPFVRARLESGSVRVVPPAAESRPLPWEAIFFTLGAVVAGIAALLTR